MNAYRVLSIHDNGGVSLAISILVMPGLVPGIHVLAQKKGVDGRDKPGHDEGQP